MSPNEATRGFTARTRSAALQIVSEAESLPPGLETRNTTASTDSSSSAQASASATVAAPATRPMERSSRLLPGRIAPSTWTTATLASAREEARRDEAT